MIVDNAADIEQPAEYCISDSTSECATPAAGGALCPSAVRTITGWFESHKSYATMRTFSRIGSFTVLFGAPGRAVLALVSALALAAR